MFVDVGLNQFLIAAVGLKPKREDVAKEWDCSDEGIERPVGDHAEIDTFRYGLLNSCNE